MRKTFLLFAINILLFHGKFVYSATDYNVILIVPDDHARRTIGVYGNKAAITPNLDKIAKYGIRFDNAYAAAPVCSPSRAAMLSGKYPSQVGLRDFLMLNDNYKDQGIDPNTVLWPELLKDHGYVTGLIGKWHLGTDENRKPTNMGFEHFIGYDQDLSPYDPTLSVQGQEMVIKGHTSEIFTTYAKNFISEYKENKFALVVAFREPQMPWQDVPEADLNAVENIDPEVPDFEGVNKEWLKKITRDNYASVHALDRSIGEIYDHLSHNDLLSKTIIFYVGDHGMLIGHHNAFGRGAIGVISGDKVVGYEGIANLYEEAIKIPFIIHLPENNRNGLVSKVPVSNIDIFPTILSYLGLDVPKDLEIEGKDILELIVNEAESMHRSIYAQYSMRNFGNSDLRMVIKDQIKLVKRFNLKAKDHLVDELYDLKSDPEEKNNLIKHNKYEQMKTDLENQLLNWMKRIDDKIK
tara:strand:- start:1424 stop:2818 length:1395 start_codon:yes stop_codon:yes gene_type:complete